MKKLVYFLMVGLAFTALQASMVEAQGNPTRNNVQSAPNGNLLGLGGQEGEEMAPLTGYDDHEDQTDTGTGMQGGVVHTLNNKYPDGVVHTDTDADGVRAGENQFGGFSGAKAALTGHETASDIVVDTESLTGHETASDIVDVFRGRR